MKGKAEMDIDLGDNAVTVYESIASELEDAISERSKTELMIKDQMIKICVSADDIVMLRATLNSFLRLINVASEMIEIVHDMGND
ncbi:MAG: KEOPS complex subunit Pcc1 [Halobacteriota archaeon]|nr:KEOPS complex subunit Pcc1 [Halobacteriota archaeon]